MNTASIIENLMVRKNNPTQTRKEILEMAATLIHQHGYKGMRVDEVVEKTGLTKGAIYYHFPNKQALGYAVVDDILGCQFKEFWSESLAQPGNVIDVLAQSFQNMCEGLEQCDLEVGCPLTNIGSEMSFEDEGFRLRIIQIFDDWTDGIEELISKGIESGEVRPDVDAKKTAQFLVASFQGIQCCAKQTKDQSRFDDGIHYLVGIVRNLAM